jgi:transcriptional regulator with XRE-family HTH domain
VGGNIRRLRQEKGILSGEIASYLGICARNLSAIESGLVRPPAAALLSLADALECTLSEFFVDSHTGDFRH